VYSPDPEYSQAARVVKREGTVLLGVILGRDGSPDDVWVIRKFVYSNGEQKTFKALGLGLEQKAIEAVRHWKFEPATKDGEPVPVFLNVEVTFRLY
jgi:periplasmic protein TonB